MPENNERFNYQSELLRRERYHSLPLATEDLSNLRRFIAPDDTNGRKSYMAAIIIRQHMQHSRAVTPRVTQSHASGDGFFFTARGRATGAASAGATESEASTGAGDFVAFFGAAGAGLAGAGDALAAGGVDGVEGADGAARGVIEVGGLIGRGALAPSGRDVPLAVGRGSPPPPMGRDELPSDRLCVDEPPGTGGRGAPGRIDGAPPSCRLVGPGVAVESGAPATPGALGD